MKKWSIVFGLALLTMAIWMCAGKPKTANKAAIAAATKTDSAERMRHLHYRLDTFFTNRSLQNGFSGSVLVSLKGQPVYEKCFGYCDFRTRDMMHDTASFQLASVSKNFTAAAVIWCAEHYLLSLDDSIQKYFPDLPYPGVRIRDLLCHRSGLPNYLYFCAKKCGTKGTYLSNRRVIEIMMLEKPAIHAKPNRKFEYCNTNYILLASIVESASGKSFKDFMHETFFQPLGMRHSFVYDINDPSERKTAISYNSKWQIQHDDCFDGVVGDKGVYSTVHDMFLWDKAYYDGKIMSQEMLKESYAPRSFEKPGVRNYGYGWRLLKKPDGNYLVYHNGWWHGNNTVFYRNVQDSSAVIILSNKYNRYVYHQVQPVWDILYGMESDTLGFEEE